MVGVLGCLIKLELLFLFMVFFKLDKTNLKNLFKFISISFFTFLLSILTLNILINVLNNIELSSKINLIIIFLINLILFLKNYNLKKKIIFFFIIIFLSIIFRIFEYFVFIYFVGLWDNINYCWILTLLLSYGFKLIIYTAVLRKCSF